MKLPSHVTLIAAARFYGPLILFVALTLLALREPGSGVGFIAGVVFAMALALHALVFGADAARQALPPIAARAVLGLGVLASVYGSAGRDAPLAAQALEAGVFAVIAAGAHIAFTVLIGRAPTLREGDLP